MNTEGKLISAQKVCKNRLKTPKASTPYFYPMRYAYLCKHFNNVEVNVKMICKINYY